MIKRVTSRRNLDRLRPYWGSVSAKDSALPAQVETVDALTTVLLDEVPLAGRIMRETALELFPSDGNSWYRADRQVIQLSRSASDALLHEFGHRLDHVAYSGTGTCALGADQWSSREQGSALWALTEQVRPLVNITDLIAARAQERFAGLPPNVVAALYAPEGIQTEDAIWATLTAAGVRIKPVMLRTDAYRRMFGAFDSAAYQAKTRLSDEVVRQVTVLARLQPQGVPLRLLGGPDAEIKRYQNTLRAAVLEKSVQAYYMSRHEVFARLFDQALRARAGIMDSREGDLTPVALQQVTPAFWRTMQQLGWAP